MHSQRNVPKAYVDLRLIYDLENDLVVIGCHKCETYESGEINDPVSIAKMVPLFAVTHIQKCYGELE